MIHLGEKALRAGAADILERGAKKTAAVDEDTALSLHVPPTGSGTLANHDK